MGGLHAGLRAGVHLCDGGCLGRGNPARNRESLMRQALKPPITAAFAAEGLLVAAELVANLLAHICVYT